MDVLRKGFDRFYDLIEMPVFYLTKRDPEIAHELFLYGCRMLYKTGLDKFVLDNSVNEKKTLISISNAAGFNKNAENPPKVMKYLGFDRVVVGTVTGEFYSGNKRPRIRRYVKSESLVNWCGLPGIGCEAVAENLRGYEGCDIPVTINLMPTPGKKDKETLDDVEKTVLWTKDLENVDRYELNISCPNTSLESGEIDARKEHERSMEQTLDVLSNALHDFQNIYLKVSPDLEVEDAKRVIAQSVDFVEGYTLTNTTTDYDSCFLVSIPERGGASRNAVYQKSKRMQELFQEELQRIGELKKIIPCGGINSLDRVIKRTSIGDVSEFQLYTPIIFSGTRLLRNFRKLLSVKEQF